MSSSEPQQQKICKYCDSPTGAKWDIDGCYSCLKERGELPPENRANPQKPPEKNGNGLPEKKTYQCSKCGAEAKYLYTIDGVRKPLCIPCFQAMPYAERVKAMTKPGEKPTPRTQARAEIRDQKKAEAIKRGEICYRCGRGCPDPGHELCYGCENATAKRKPISREVGRMPESCMYGWLGEFARKIDSPLDAAYPVLLGIAAGYGVPSYKRLRSNLFVNVIGTKGDGKSRVIRNAREAWPNPSEIKVIKKYPGSEVGLIQLLGGKKGNDMKADDYHPMPYLLIQDEMRVTFNKMDIKGSSLPNMLNELFYEDTFGTASKQGHWECCARLSLVGCLTCDGPDEFAEIYGAATAQGTYDRMLFAVFPSGWEFDDLWEPPTESPGNDITDNLPISRRPRPCEVPAWAYERIAEWRRKDFENRKRLGELALRVALVTASVNHDKEITEDCLRCALEFIEWQEAIRRFYAPAETDDLDGKAERAIIRALEEQTDWVEWRELCTRKNLYRSAKSSVRLNRVKKAMIYERVIEEEYELKNDGSNGGRTGRVRLSR